MRDLTMPLSEPKQRVLDAAEQLFAERGFDAVSVRDIAQLAKANVAAVNYHFGTRDGLIALVIGRYLTPVNDARLVRLDQLEHRTAGKVIPLEELIDAFVRPVAGSGPKSELAERPRTQLLGWIFARQGWGWPPAMEEQMRQVSARFARALGRSLPGLSSEESVWRTHFVVGAMIHLLQQPLPLAQLTPGTATAPPLDATLGRFIRFAIAGLRDGVEPDAPVKKGPQAVFDF